jgi:hypothetical protein
VTKRVLVLAIGGLAALAQPSYGQFQLGFGISCGHPTGVGGGRFYGPQFYGPPAQFYGAPTYFAPPQYFAPTTFVPTTDVPTTVGPTTLYYAPVVPGNGRPQAMGPKAADAEADLVAAIKQLSQSIDRLRESKGGTMANPPRPTPATSPPPKPAPGTGDMGLKKTATDDLCAEIAARFARPAVAAK